MASPAQLSQLRALLRSLKYMFAIASLVAVAGIVFLATVHARVTTDVLIGMVLCLCILLTGAFFGWFALWRDPRLRFLHADGLRVRPRRTRLPVIELGPLPAYHPRPGNVLANLEQVPLARPETPLLYIRGFLGGYRY